jgi:disulfide oxidoreductase YuzD
MKKIFNLFLYSGVFCLAVFFIWTVYNDNHLKATDSLKNNSVNAESQKIKPADKIQVYLFHATQRCSSCIAIGKFAKETVEQKFSEELKSGKIEFREINIDLPENKELATKFKATGSALFINSIYDGQDHIKDDTQVWRLVSNEQGFISYLSDKLNKLLGK